MAVIETQGLTKRYGVVDALDDLDLHVPAGTVFGYLGPNGAGKSTTIRMLMGLIRASSGSATVLGHDIVCERLMIHRAVGYLPGDFNAYRDLTGEQYLSYLARLRGDVDPNEVQRLAERFHLDLGSRIGALSHGNRQKVGIVQACMHQPELLILDEPTSGLDPLMQHEFLDLIREYRGSGRTVFLSSHALPEVEAIADIVGIIRKGRLVMTSSVSDLKSRARRRVEMRFVRGVEPPIGDLRAVAAVRHLEAVDGEVRIVVEGSMDELLRVAAPFGIERIVSNEVDLEDVFREYYEGAGH